MKIFSSTSPCTIQKKKEKHGAEAETKEKKTLCEVGTGVLIYF